MNKDWVLTQESFDALLAWLDPRRENAAEQYEDIRLRLIKIFTCRGCYEPEDLADETINRVIKKLKDIESSFIGDPRRYFYGVANKVHMESLRRKPAQPPPAPTKDDDEIERQEREDECLERCLGQLTSDNRELFEQYFKCEKKAKIEHRKRLAEQLGIALNALRIRAHRIRAFLQQCMQDCLEQAVG